MKKLPLNLRERIQRIVVILLIIPTISKAQDKDTSTVPLNSGIHFESGLSWPDVLAKAKVANKYIFVDCYASWCAPCRYMSQHIFPQQEIGDYFNAHFISVAVQMDQTAHDSKQIQQWYTAARSLNEKYSIELYPTYLFFSPDGLPIHRIVGGANDAKGFLAKVQDVFSFDRQYYPLIGHYKEHFGDSLFLRKALTIALDAGDQVNASTIGDKYMDCLKDPYAPDNIRFIVQLTKTCRDRAFNILLANPTRANKGLGENAYTEQFLRIMIARNLADSIFYKVHESIDWTLVVSQLKNEYPTLGNGDDVVKVAEAILKKYIEKKKLEPLYSVDVPPVSWGEVIKEIKKRYKGLDVDQLLAKDKIEFYKYRKNYPEFEKAVFAYAQQYETRLSKKELNSLAWDDIFLYSKDKETLQLGLRLSKQTITNYPDADIAHVDTYANLLYKLGNKKEAIVWEKKALDIRNTIPGGDAKEFEITLDKMEKGEKTWPDEMSPTK